jgi:hypothetical protein
MKDERIRLHEAREVIGKKVGFTISEPYAHPTPESFDCNHAGGLCPGTNIMGCTLSNAPVARGPNREKFPYCPVYARQELEAQEHEETISGSRWYKHPGLEDFTPTGETPILPFNLAIGISTR